MKTHLLILSSLVIFGACSTSQSSKDRIIDHLKQGPNYAEGDFDKRFYDSQSDAMTSRAIGIAEYSVNYNDDFIKKVASHAAKVRLLESSSTNLNSDSNNQIGLSTSGMNFFEQKESIKTAIKNVKGIKIIEKDIECRTKIKPMIDGDYIYTRECRAIAQIPSYQLKEIQDRYSIEEKTEVPESKNKI